MKKSYQKRIDNLSRGLYEVNAGSLSKNTTLEDLPEIEGLDEILELPQPLREISLVKAICDSHKSRRKVKNNPIERSTSKIPELAAWEESAKGQIYNSQN